MRAVELDFMQSARRVTGGGLVLLAVGAAAVVMVLLYRAELRGEEQLLDSQVGKLERKARAVPVGVQMDESARQEVLRANEVIDQLALPWEPLFHAIEAAATERVVLLGIAPDAKTGTVQITAETFDAQAMFEYLERLAGQGELSRVYLLQHQLEHTAVARPLRFTVAASWIQ